MPGLDLHNNAAFAADELRRLIYMDVIKTITQEMTHFQELQPLCDYVVTVLQHRLHFHMTSIFRYDELYQVATLVAQQGDDEQTTLTGTVQSVHLGVLGRAMREGKTLLIDDTSKLTDYAIAEGSAAPAHAALCVPISTSEAIWGAFHVENSTAGSFVYYDQAAFELIATYLGNTIARLELAQQQQRLLADLGRQEQRQQQLLAQVAQLAAPLFLVQPGILALPLLGHLDDERMQHISTALLARLEQSNASSLLLDLAGVTHLPEQAAQALSMLIAAANERGTAVIISGPQPAADASLASLDIQPGKVVRCTTFAAGLIYALQQQGQGTDST